MLMGYVDQIEPNVISGWAADTDIPEEAVSVVIHVDNKRIATIICDQNRPDLRVVEGLRGHLNHGFRYEFSSPLDLSRVGSVSVRFARTGKLLQKGQITGLPPSRLTPILVTAPGRSGTTFLMNRLAQSPKICVVEVPPFEMRLLAYWAAVYRTLTAEADFDKSTHPDRPEGDGFHIGSNPYSHQVYAKGFKEVSLFSEYFSKFVPDAVAELIRNIINEHYLRLRDDQKKSSAVYFAEKCNSLYRPTRINSRIFYPDLKEIILIRDPRDVLMSHVSFFHREVSRAFKEIGEYCIELLRLRKNRTEFQFFLKYEDMVSGQADAFKKLSDFLGVPDLERGNPERESTIFRVHATSKTPTESIGRWRELPADIAHRCNNTWAEFLDEFGYER